MSRYYLVFLITSFLSLFNYCNAQTQPTPAVGTNVVVTTPPPKSVSCNTIAAHWEGNIWIDSQTVCKYENRTEGVAWLQDYWACTSSSADGTCTTWEYRPGHWVQTLPLQ